MSGWYSMLTEVLACDACRKAAKESEEHTFGRYLLWDQCILNQLSPAHRAVFPAVLTLRRGVDKQVIRLMRDRTEGNTMVKVWRQVQESHCGDYLQRKDLYTTLLSQYNKPGKIISALNKLDLDDRSIQQFDSLYSARWGNALFGRTSGDPTEASLVQKFKFSKRYSAAHLVDSRKDRLMYCLVKQLWLHPGVGGKAKGSPLKQQITKLYQRVQQRVTVDDDQLSKLGIPILKINSKCVSEFIRRQEALSATNVIDQGLSVLRRHQSVSSTSQPPAEELPEERPHTSRPPVQYPITTSLAGTRKLKQRLPQILPVPPSALAQPVPAPAHSMPAGLRHTHTPLTAPPAVSLPQASTPPLLPSRSTV
nr:uncharacterized protein LOC101885685 [Danio rerio]|eukprot:XP_009298892.1 uncharacterized protein LOC101885685 [Danio rerio]